MATIFSYIRDLFFSNRVNTKDDMATTLLESSTTTANIILTFLTPSKNIFLRVAFKAASDLGNKVTETPKVGLNLKIFARTLM